jgi:sulfur-carrier protein
VPQASTAIRVDVLFFGRLKEVLATKELSCEIPDGCTLEMLFAKLAAQHPQLAGYRASLVCSRNQEFVAWDTPLRAGDEVAFLPPVSGG